MHPHTVCVCRVCSYIHIRFRRIVWIITRPFFFFLFLFLFLFLFFSFLFSSPLLFSSSLAFGLGETCAMYIPYLHT